jgi:uncharacterized RDD family membrane protein YckC
MENQELKFASFGQRVLARVIDVIIVFSVARLLASIFVFTFILDSNEFEFYPEREIRDIFSRYIFSFSHAFRGLIFCFIYQPILEARGGTLGKKLVGLRTINLNTGKAPSIGNSYARSAFLSGLAVLWSNKKQTWHDSLTNIAVVSDSSLKGCSSWLVGMLIFFIALTNLGAEYKAPAVVGFVGLLGIISVFIWLHKREKKHQKNQFMERD